MTSLSTSWPLVRFAEWQSSFILEDGAVVLFRSQTDLASRSVQICSFCSFTGWLLVRIAEG